MLNILANPILYTWLNQEFRQTIIQFAFQFWHTITRSKNPRLFLPRPVYQPTEMDNEALMSLKKRRISERAGSDFSALTPAKLTPENSSRNVPTEHSAMIHKGRKSPQFLQAETYIVTKINDLGSTML